MVAVVIVCLVFLFLLMLLPRRRETARNLGCQRNLAQIGVALAIYNRSTDALPGVPPLTIPPDPSHGPLLALLKTLNVQEFTGLTPPEVKSKTKTAPFSGKIGRVPTFHCPSDLKAVLESQFTAPVSYRATTGDQVGGVNGAFAPGRSMSLAEVELNDGASFTAAFSERRIGSGRADDQGLASYRIVETIDPKSADSNAGAWQADAGTTWAEASWRSTLYNHALPPNAVGSCIASDGKSAYMGASSGHIGGVNVLMLDGAARVVTPSIDEHIWKSLATTSSTEASPSTSNPTSTRSPQK